MRHFLNLYNLIDEWSKFNSDPFKCFDLARKAELEDQIKCEFHKLTLVKIIDFFRKN